MPVGTISTIVDDTFAFSESLANNLYRGVLQTIALAEDPRCRDADSR